MSTTVRQRESKLSDRLPADWKKRIAAYRGSPALHFKRVMKTLNEFEWMTQEERERAAYVIVEKEQLREQGFEVEEDD